MTKIHEVVSDNEFVALLFQYSSGGKSKEEFQKEFERLGKQLKTTKFYISVAGVQGAGKSTFLNSLTFDFPVLPIDANETTCVPVEIEYGHSDKATVVFKDGREVKTNCTEEGLMRYVHNDNNPGNRDGVSHIIVQSKHEFLRRGLVLVDLPGVGSLTPENLETTRSYLLKSTAVLFLLRTVPPITRSDASFISGVWSQSPTTYFVQNQWDDEGKDEVQEGLEDNQEKLSKIATRMYIPLQGEKPEIMVVNALRAWEGILKKDSSEFAKSGITKVQTEFANVGKNWPQIREDRIRIHIYQKIKVGIVEIDQQLSLLDKDVGEIRKAEKEAKQDFRLYEEGLNKQHNKLLQILNDAKKAIDGIILNWKEKDGSELKNSVRSAIRAGAFDGAKLERVLEDKQQEAGELLNDMVQERLAEMQHEIMEVNFESWEEQELRNLEANIEEKKRLENILPPAVGGAGAILGGLGGVALAGTAAGTAAAAKLGAALGMAAGPAGMVVGAVLGAAGAFIGGWLFGKGGHKLKQMRQEKIAENTIQQVMPILQQFLDDTGKQYQDVVFETIQKINKDIAKWHEEQRKTFKKQQEERKSVRRSSFEEKELKRSNLENDMKQLLDYVNLLGVDNG